MRARAASIAAFDILMLDRERRGRWTSAILAWAPFVLMTAGYLLLRRSLLGHSVRGGVSAWHQVETFLGIVWRHLHRVTLGNPSASETEVWAMVALTVLALLAVVQMRARGVRVVLCFVLGHGPMPFSASFRKSVRQ